MVGDGAAGGGDSGRLQSSDRSPVARADPQPATEPSARATTNPSGTSTSTTDEPRPHVLVVDDHRAIRRSLCRLLETRGYHAEEADCVAAARDRLSDRRFDVVLLDIDMPGERGTALLPHLAPLAPHTMVIMVTGSGDAQVAVSTLKQGAFDYICKPFTNEQVFEAIEQALQHRQGVLQEQARQTDLEAVIRERTQALHLALSRLEGAQAAIKRVACSLAEIRDAETGAHLHRMAVYSRALAEALPLRARTAHGIDDAYVALLAEAAPLHDIGKIGIPDRILLKRGPLTEDERETMMQHPRIGRAILEAAAARMGPDAPPIIRIGIEICAFHHERYDGTGYPEGLRGEQIPMSARLVAVADVYDALATPRLYRPEALAHETVRDMILAESGAAFDPAVVEAFTAADDEMAAVAGEALSHETETLGDTNEAEPVIHVLPLPSFTARAARNGDPWAGRAFVETARELGLIS